MASVEVACPVVDRTVQRAHRTSGTSAIAEADE